MNTSTYNYRSFPLDMDMDDFVRFPEVARVGTKAPDGELTEAGPEPDEIPTPGRTVRLSELFRNRVAVLEFGSLT